MNPLNKFNNQIPQQNGNMNPMQMISQFIQFAKGYKGNAEQEVMKMLSSGQISKEELEQVVNYAKQFQGMFGGK